VGFALTGRRKQRVEEALTEQSLASINVATRFDLIENIRRLIERGETDLGCALLLTARRFAQELALIYVVPAATLAAWKKTYGVIVLEEN